MHQRNASVTGAVLPVSVVRYVVRTGEDVILDDATTANSFSADAYIVQNSARSIVCLPLVNQARLNGVLYLENNLTAHVFTSDRITVLKVLASQAAISLENTRLYADLRQREAKIRRLVEANVVGIAMWNLEGAITGANEAFLRMMQYDREDLPKLFGRSLNDSGCVRWTGLTPAEWRDRDERAIAQLKESGVFQPYEKEYFRKDGSRVPILLGGALFENSGNEGVAFILDLSEQKRAEEALRRSEKELRDVIDTIPAMVWAGKGTESGDYVHASVSKRWAEYIGLAEAEAAGSGWQAAVHPEDLQQLLDKWRVSLATGKPVDHESRFRRAADSEYRWMLVRGVPFRDEHGHILKWYGTLTDIEDRKRAEAEIRALKDQLYRENLALRDEIDRASMFEEIVGTSNALRVVLSHIAKVAPTDSTVFIIGETGTGKELIARAVHKRSQRNGRAFVSVNCAALAPSLISSELFGHEKGAFTGATQRRLGRFELADGGTIFLDEVGELPPDTQVALLRVLQEREFERVGGTQSIRVDVRVIAATNRDLKAAVGKGTFREDLFYRLNVFPITVPPLRERREDILMLVEYFVQRYAKRAGKNIQSIDKKTLDLLQAYDWPGNIRELQNVIERSVILSSGDVLSVDALWLSKESSRPPS
ncbi:MAG TPA: sigma 54-interacting transcriptional regulator, partial [Terriglobales bacterium]